VRHFHTTLTHYLHQHLPVDSPSESGAP
jgi:hypothetical protein